jgi:TM2 domain-containing membrane protein YozV
MIRSDDKNTGKRSPPEAKSISAHRAFVYAASAPGLGEFYAGCRLRGLVTAALFISATVWFARALFVILSRIMDRIFDSLSGAVPFVLPDVPYLSAAISFFALYFIWLWAMIGAIDAATTHRRRSGEPPQASVAWAVAAAWFCPGAGHVYAGYRRYGYLLFAAYLLTIPAVVPAYKQLFNSISQLASSGELTSIDPFSVMRRVHELVARAEYSCGKLLGVSVRYFAIGGAIHLIQQRLPETDTRWSQPSAGYGMALLAIGWLCPGAGQLLQKRDPLGWSLLAAYIGSKLFAGFLLRYDFIDVPAADLWGWVSVVIQWGAMAEALLWMIRAAKRM